MQLLTLLLKSSVVITLFLLVYYLLMNKSSHFSINRFFLLCGLVLAISIPFMRIAYPVYIEIETPEVIEPSENHVTTTVVNTEIIPEIPANVATKPAEVSINWENLAWWMYAGISLLFLLRLLGSFLYSFYLLKTAQQIQWKSNKYYLHPKVKNPMTFASFIFIPSREYLEDHKEQVLIHELIHKKQHHWVDMLLGELLLALYWINPLVWLYKQCVKNNLEYIADRGVLDTGLQLNTYIQSILCETMGTETILLANHFQTSQNKQRLKMMKNIKQSRWGKIKLLLILPLTGLILWAFSTPEYIYQQQDNKIINYKELWKDKTDSVTISLFDGPYTREVRQLDGTYKKVIVSNELYYNGILTIRDGKTINIPLSEVYIEQPINKGDTIILNIPGHYPKQTIFTGQKVIYADSKPKERKTATGKIITNNGLPNVHIIVDGDEIGAISDSKGFFELSVYDGAVLSFYHPEYKSKKVIYHSGDKLEISLEKKRSVSDSEYITVSGQVYFADTLFYLQDNGSYKTKIITYPRHKSNISIKGTDISIPSDYHKGYIIYNINPNDTLVFSYPGFKTKEVVYNEDTTISPILEREDYYYYELPEMHNNYFGKTDISITKEKQIRPEGYPELELTMFPDYQYGEITFFKELYLKSALLAQEQKLKGTAYVKFVIDEKGKMVSTVPFGNTDQKILDAAEQIVQELNEWYPGYKAGKYRAFTMCVKVEF